MSETIKSCATVALIVSWLCAWSLMMAGNLPDGLLAVVIAVIAGLVLCRTLR